MNALDNLKAKLQAVFKRKSEKKPAEQADASKPAETAPPATDATAAAPTETTTSAAAARKFNGDSIRYWLTSCFQPSMRQPPPLILPPPKQRRLMLLSQV